MYASSPLCQPMCHDQFSISLTTNDSINNTSTTVDQVVRSTLCNQNIFRSTLSSQSDDQIIDYSVSTPSPPPSQPTPSAPNLPNWMDNDGVTCTYIKSYIYLVLPTCSPSHQIDQGTLTSPSWKDKDGWSYILHI